MIGSEPMARAQSRLRFFAGAVAALALCVLAAGVPGTLHAQVSQGVQKGAREGSKAAGPIGGVLGGAIGGVVGAVGGVVGAVTGGNKGSQPAAKQDGSPFKHAALIEMAEIGKSDEYNAENIVQDRVDSRWQNAHLDLSSMNGDAPVTQSFSAGRGSRRN